jgi:cytochrome c oxidase cbb3-type subunit III
MQHRCRSGEKVVSDFTSDFWGWYVAVMTVASVLACGVLLYTCSTKKPGGGTLDTTGHTWDEDLSEWNNPLPRWWMWLFYITIVFGLVYIALYPGLGNYAGALGWTSSSQYTEEQRQAAAQYGPIFETYLQQDIVAVAANPEARAIGQRLFLNYCSQCHGSDAGGSKGFPNLRDADWLYGGEPETIKTSIANGRNGVMPPMGAALGSDSDVKNVAHYVMSLSGRTHDELRAAQGRQKFAGACAACHMPTGKGNPALGAPNLTDATWLHGGTEAAIMDTIRRGRINSMPAHKAFLDDGKIHLLAAYVYSLSQPDKK